MAELLTIQDLANGHLDVKALGEAANGDENTEVITRTGETYPSAAKTMRLLSEMGIGFTPFETKSEMTASAKPDGTYAVVTNDTVTNLGVYLKKSGAWALVPWNNFASLDGLRINAGKVYPFKNISRDGVVSPSSSVWLDVILDVTVLNAKPDNYYQLAYFANGLIKSGASPDGNGWRIYKFDTSSFDITSNAVEIIAYTEPQAKPKANSVDTVSLVSASGEVITITLDTSKLPPSGIPLAATTTSQKGYSDIIDPSCYLYTTDTDTAKERIAVLDSININSGKVYPLKYVKRGTSNVTPVVAWVDALLDVKVINAKEGCYYHIAYFSNGNTAFLPDGSGWGIQRFLKADYANDAAVDYLIGFRTAQQQLKASGVDTITLKSTDGEVFVITLNVDKLPANGELITSTVSDRKGYSYIIDPSCYIYSSASSTPSVDKQTTGMYATLTAGRLQVAYQSGAKEYRLTFAPNGHNGLPNIVGYEHRNVGDVSWTVYYHQDTDWLPPLKVIAGYTGDSSGITTGGNHGGDGGGGGAKTARNVYYSVKFDGMQQDAFDGYCDTVEITHVNELMATNTIDVGRYVIREAFNLKIINGAITVTAQRTALEPVTIINDYGIMAVSGGFRGSYLILDGQYATRQQGYPEFDSGAKSAYPNAWAIVAQENNDQLVMWLDRSYGIGDGRYVSDADSILKRGPTTNSKIYASIVANQYIDMQAGDNYAWRGGYHVKSVATKPLGADSEFSANGKNVIVYSAKDYMTI